MEQLKDILLDKHSLSSRKVLNPRTKRLDIYKLQKTAISTNRLILEPPGTIIIELQVYFSTAYF